MMADLNIQDSVLYNVEEKLPSVIEDLFSVQEVTTNIRKLGSNGTLSTRVTNIGTFIFVVLIGGDLWRFVRSEATAASHRGSFGDVSPATHLSIVLHGCRVHQLAVGR